MVRHRALLLHDRVLKFDMFALVRLMVIDRVHLTYQLVTLKFIDKLVERFWEVSCSVLIAAVFIIKLKLVDLILQLGEV